ncbi:MAG: carboxymuconolactone decarboxylase family protein [Rhodocyclaceae bacterium]|jgi:alkylhydroperoxidase family enzyme|nr:carboxymuconolactone decarboxylase family protein [Rhodocyclaceae bacterium]MBK6552459.1 carboxymuconolactone decarboxylase family protein [Rhodocyclaceae bacterium]MBK6675616.1 carboxymuconolactone decarboxylase family protein [Rhodocyclaceae bacterium]MBK9311995.1 carboxymuconolactone decarboxylase family protein [Rhodocyclaceae bacterium]MBK9953693.1 carboxymuconolactone decarboxylase family protein [Rhodocyclaceae bacterium]
MATKSRVTAPSSPKTGHVIRDSAFGLAADLLEPVVRLTHLNWAASSVNPGLIEMLRLRNARTVNCVICKSTRYDVAHRDGTTEEKLALVDDGYQNSNLDRREKLALEFADTYLQDPDRASPDLMARLRQEFSPRQIGDMAVAIATFHAMSRCAVGLGGMPENMPVFIMSPPSA